MANVSIIYWSGTGNTEKMAELIAEGAKAAGANVKEIKVGDASLDDVKACDVLVLGCPSMGDEVLEESEMEPFVDSLEAVVSGKKVALFGSYGWGDGAWMRDWAERMKGYGAALVEAEGLIVNATPDSDGEDKCRGLGKKVAAA